MKGSLPPMPQIVICDDPETYVPSRRYSLGNGVLLIPREIAQNSPVPYARPVDRLYPGALLAHRMYVAMRGAEIDLQQELAEHRQHVHFAIAPECKTYSMTLELCPPVNPGLISMFNGDFTDDYRAAHDDDRPRWWRRAWTRFLDLFRDDLTPSPVQFTTRDPWTDPLMMDD